MTAMDALSQSVRAFWGAYLAQHDDPAHAQSRFLEAFQIGSTEEDANEGADLIVSGAKTATSSLLWKYEAVGTRPPQEGDLSIVLNGQEEPVCVVETTWVAVQPFAQVDAQFARDYGEWDRTLTTWVEQCWDYYSEQCEELGRTASPEMPLVCERFRVVFSATG